MGDRRVLFLCTGNYYRSRHAEIYFNWLARQAGASWHAVSRGLSLSHLNVGPVSPHTAARVAGLSLDISPAERFPEAVCEHDFATAQHVVAVKGGEHRTMIAKAFPHQLGKVEFWEIHDLDCADPRDALPDLERHVERLFDRLVVAGTGSAQTAQ